MQNNMKIKSKIYLIAFIASTSLLMQSCTKEDTNSFKCTTYLNGAVWSEKTVSDCSLCTAPQGYTTTCN
jgi:hypothetical protein